MNSQIEHVSHLSDLESLQIDLKATIVVRGFSGALDT